MSGSDQHPRLPLSGRCQTESRTVPSLRVLSVVILTGMGAVAALVGGAGSASQPAPSRDNLTTASPVASGAATATQASGAGVSTDGSAEPALDVRAENQKPGTPGWRIGRARGNEPGLAGYAGAVSVQSGQSVPLRVSGSGSVRVRALRIGWYGGVGARQVWESTMQAQPETADPSAWPVRGQADTTGWPAGHYLLRLDQGEASRYLSLTVRSSDNKARIVVLTSPLTWVAENGGADPAAGSGSGTASDQLASTVTPNSASAATPTTALAEISFDQPYAAGYGSGGFLEHDLGIVQLAERTGHQIGYATDYDVATDPTLLSNASAVLTGGDSQYWTASLRKAIRQAGDGGTNFASFGAGAGSRQVLLAGSGRVLQIARGKPSSSVRITGLRPSCSTESTDTGLTESADWIVSSSDWWGYRGTGVKADDAIPGLVAGRVDRAATAATGSPTPMQVLASTQVQCASSTGTGSSPVVQSGAYSARSSGAGIFASGTSRWACSLVAACTDEAGQKIKLSKSTERITSRITRNVINAFAKRKAAKRHPAINNADLFASLR